uniref:NADH-ubiquinone oxidoreductase chain 6 n=1 Tax=Lepidosiren paradoxus TaxID=7883 RepID=Q8WDS9_LEPPA|nr:NADH dehydrogenase subunit 6 [Lepidosiren paradoxa]AAL55255.1 NADH dehydrogenase subunit 6 [Lepidosiren paradoxa]
MSYIFVMLLVGFIISLIGVASNPSPMFAALGLVCGAAFGCGILVWLGGSFLSLVLFLIYLGGMLVVFAYSVALSSEEYPEAWMDWPVMMNFIMLGGVTVWWWVFLEVGVDVMSGMEYMELMVKDFIGLGWVYGVCGGLLILSVWALFLALLVVLEVTRGVSRGALRSVY